jgi:hypothetical protein
MPVARFGIGAWLDSLKIYESNTILVQLVYGVNTIAKAFRVV